MAPRVVGTYASPVATRASQKATTCGRVRATVSYYYSVNGRTAYMTADPAGRVCSAVAINNQRRLFEWKLCEFYRISFGVDLDACICYGKSRNKEQQRQTYVQQHAAAQHTTRIQFGITTQTAHTLVIHAWSHGLVATRSTATPAGRWASESVAVRGAEAAAAEAAAPAAGEPLGPADVGAVGPAEAGAPEPVALRLARPRLRHRHRPDLCSTQQHLRHLIISTESTAQKTCKTASRPHQRTCGQQQQHDEEDGREELARELHFFLGSQRRRATLCDRVGIQAETNTGWCPSSLWPVPYL